MQSLQEVKVLQGPDVSLRYTVIVRLLDSKNGLPARPARVFFINKRRSSRIPNQMQY